MVLGLAWAIAILQPIALPFTFPFYGRWHGQAWVNANGFPQLRAATAVATTPLIPVCQSLSPNGAVYTLWDDLNPGQGGRVSVRQHSGWRLCSGMAWVICQGRLTPSPTPSR